jgi:hypothetical protein
LYVVIFNGYVQAFTQSSFYKEYLKGGQLRQALNNHEFHLQRASQFYNLLQVNVVVTKYALIFLIHQGCHIWKVIKFLDPRNDLQIFSKVQREICTYMLIVLISLL